MVLDYPVNVCAVARCLSPLPSTVVQWSRLRFANVPVPRYSSVPVVASAPDRSGVLTGFAVRRRDIVPGYKGLKCGPSALLFARVVK